ncbi:MAG: DUF4276 family protein [Sphaerospermopsis sp. SIO1G2]|nr:DUF4276 family protein [Sphaerospermopsis sp. SIO1G2]
MFLVNQNLSLALSNYTLHNPFVASRLFQQTLINDSKETAPSKRIISQFPDYERSKPLLGSLLAESIGLETIRNKCPHFNSWLLKLESLNQKITP